MMDIVLDRMAKDARLGLVFPDDPHLSDWDDNRDIARAACSADGHSAINFRRSSIFRSAPCSGRAVQALAPLFDLRPRLDRLSRRSPRRSTGRSCTRSSGCFRSWPSIKDTDTP